MDGCRRLLFLLDVEGADDTCRVALALVARDGFGMGGFFSGMDEEGFCRSVGTAACAVLRAALGVPTADLDDRDCQVGLPGGRVTVHDSKVGSVKADWFLANGEDPSDGAKRCGEILSSWGAESFGGLCEVFLGDGVPSSYHIFASGLSGTVMDGVHERLEAQSERVCMEGSVRDAPRRGGAPCV